MAFWEAVAYNKIERSLFRTLRKKEGVVTQLATQNVKDAFKNPNWLKYPIKTGYTRKTTYAKAVFGRNVSSILFITPNEKRGSEGDGYARHPLLGTSTSEKYKVRNWLVGGAILTRKRLINNWPK
jgi:hypothetical protein